MKRNIISGIVFGQVFSVCSDDEAIVALIDALIEGKVHALDRACFLVCEVPGGVIVDSGISVGGIIVECLEQCLDDRLVIYVIQ